MRQQEKGEQTKGQGINPKATETNWRIRTRATNKRKCKTRLTKDEKRNQPIRTKKDEEKEKKA